MKQKFLNWGTLVVIAVTLFTSCKKDKGETNDEEVITTVTLSFTPVGGGTPLTFSFNDADGPGGNAPTIDDIVLAANTTYNVATTFENVLTGEDVTEEIEEEAEAHRIYYAVAVGSNISVSNLNNDVNGIALGTTSTWTTTAAANGQVTVTLRHYAADPPNKEAGDPVNSPKSSTDIEVTFDTEVQ